MDANGLAFCLLADAPHWAIEGDALEFDPSTRSLRLSRHREAPAWPADEILASARLGAVPQSVDVFGTRAFWSPEAKRVVASGAAPGMTALWAPPPGVPVTDVAIGQDDLLYIAAGGAIVVLDPRRRFPPARVEAPDGFQAWRLAAAAGGGVHALDNAGRRLARLRGRPSAARPHPAYAPDVVRPCEENSDPPRVTIAAEAVFDVDERPVAIASSPKGRVAVLAWRAGELARVREVTADGRLGVARLLEGARDPYSLAWVSETSVGVLLPAVAEAPVYTLDDAATTVPPDGAYYPLRDHDGGPFVHGSALPPRYPSADEYRPLRSLSLPSFEARGSARNAMRLDAGRRSAVWHRLYVEAAIPDHCQIVVWLAAGDDPDAEPTTWYPHRFGGMPADGVMPRGAWVSAPSEIPFHPGLLRSAPERDRAGLFTALVQRAGLRVRGLRGRWLHVRVELSGGGLATPQLAAVRAYASRFSYVDRYLPELYREDLFGPEADAAGDATPADFLERFLDNFEGVLTQVEDRVADAWLLTDPDAAPAGALEWLGSWIGVAFEGAHDEPCRRAMLRAAPELFRRRGTVRGLALALDLATSGRVARGDIVLVEGFRLRRTFATILGAHLSDELDPLLAGIAQSGNSFVGDTLFLGDEGRREFLALFAADLRTTADEQAVVDAFFDALANRVTVLVHDGAEGQELALIRRVAALETPAHVAVRVEKATTEFRAGIASLVGADTYLAPRLPPRTARLDGSWVGRGDLVERLPALDPRLEGEDTSGSDPPVARLDAPPVAELGQPFRLSGAGSSPAEGRQITKYLWTQND